MRVSLRVSAGVLLVAVLACARSAGADPFRVVLGQDATYDGNFFRLMKGATPNVDATGITAPSRSELVFRTSATLGFDRAYRRQHPHAEFTFTHYAHRTYQYLDFNGLSGRAGWDSQIGRRLKSAVNYERASTPGSDAAQTGFRASDRSDSRLTGEADYLVRRRLSLGAGLTAVGSHYNSTVNPLSDHTALLPEARITFESRRGSYVRALVRQTTGHYSADGGTQTQAAKTSYAQTDYETEVKWVLDEHSSLLGRAGYSRFTDEALASGYQRVEGATGRLTYEWSPTSRTKLSAAVNRDISLDVLSYLGAAVVASAGATVSASAALSEKVTVGGAGSWRTQTLGREAVASSGSVNGPRYLQVSLNSSWAVRRWLLLGLAAGHEARGGNSGVGPDFHDNTVTANAQLVFQ